MAEEKKDCGLFHDDDGNTDDRRIAAWVLMAALIGIVSYGVWHDIAISVEVFKIGIWPTVVLFGATVAEKFKRP